METFTGYIKKIDINPNRGFDVTICIYNSEEINEVLNFENNSEFNLHSQEYIITITNNTMAPSKNNELEECMEVYHKYEYTDSLNPVLRRQWKTGLLIDNFAYKIITSGILNKMTSEEIEKGK